MGRLQIACFVLSVVLGEVLVGGVEPEVQPMDVILFLDGAPSYLRLTNSTSLESVFTCILDNSRNVDSVILATQMRGMLMDVGKVEDTASDMIFGLAANAARNGRTLWKTPEDMKMLKARLAKYLTANYYDNKPIIDPEGYFNYKSQRSAEVLYNGRGQQLANFPRTYSRWEESPHLPPESRGHHFIPDARGNSQQHPMASVPAQRLMARQTSKPPSEPSLAPPAQVSTSAAAPVPVSTSNAADPSQNAPALSPESQNSPPAPVPTSEPLYNPNIAVFGVPSSEPASTPRSGALHLPELSVPAFNPSSYISLPPPFPVSEVTDGPQRAGVFVPEFDVSVPAPVSPSQPEAQHITMSGPQTVSPPGPVNALEIAQALEAAHGLENTTELSLQSSISVSVPKSFVREAPTENVTQHPLPPNDSQRSEMPSSAQQFADHPNPSMAQVHPYQMDVQLEAGVLPETTSTTERAKAEQEGTTVGAIAKEPETMTVQSEVFSSVYPMLTGVKVPPSEGPQVVVGESILATPSGRTFPNGETVQRTRSALGNESFSSLETISDGTDPRNASEVVFSVINATSVLPSVGGALNKTEANEEDVTADASSATKSSEESSGDVEDGDRLKKRKKKGKRRNPKKKALKGNRKRRRAVLGDGQWN